MAKKKIKRLEMIIKVSERRNINCSYCYVFNLGNDMSLNAKPVISHHIIQDLRAFFEQASQEYDIDTIQVDFHGGEPLMIGKARFARACDELVSDQCHSY